jgi:hypothetical protein
VVRSLEGGKGSSVAMWLLERRFPREYGLHAKIEASDNLDEDALTFEKLLRGAKT